MSSPSIARAASAIALVAALLAASSGAPAGASTGGEQPFRASFDGTFEVAGPLLTFTGTGTATGLGASTVDGTSVVAPAAPTPACPLPKVTLALVFDRVTLTAASGDRIVFRNSGTDCLDPATGVIVADATYEILGGTGRFAGAGGTGTVTVTARCADGSCRHGTFHDLRFDGSLT